MPDILPIDEKNEKEKPRVRSENQDNLVKDLFFGTAEKTLRESYQDPSSLYNPYNPDDLYQQTGDYTIYEEMENDDQVAVCLQLKDDLILGSGYTFETQEDDQQEIQWDLEKAFFEDADRSIDEILSEILSANRFGFSLSEKIFKHRDDGSLTIKDIKTRHPNTWLIETDKQGNVVSYQQQAGTAENIKIEPKSLIHFVNRARFGNPYGKSDLRDAYNAWFVKRHIVRFYSIFLEKAASPTPVGKYDAVKTEKQDVDDVFAALKKLQTKTALVIPNSIDVEWLQSGNNGDAFIKGINVFNMFIGRALLIPDLMGYQGGETGGGSYSLGKEQIGLFARHVERRRKLLERAINKHIVEPLVNYNFGFVEHYPKFKLKPISEENTLEFAKVFLTAVNGKLYKPTEEEINHFRDLIGFPQSDDVEIFPSGGGSSQPPTQQQSPFSPIDETMDDDGETQGVDDGEQKADGEKGESESGSTEKSTDEKSGEQKEKVIDEEMDKSENDESVTDQKKYIGDVFDFPSGEYHKKVDFKALEVQMEANEKRTMSMLKPIMVEAYKDMFAQMEKRNIIAGQKVDKIDSVKIKPTYEKQMYKVLNENFEKHYQESQELARGEIFKSNFALPLPSDKFKKLLASETFEFIRKWAYDATVKAQVEMRNAIKDGRPLSSVVDLLTEEGMVDSEASLERFSRTKTTEFMNYARVDYFTETGVVSGYQYSAILDGRTSPICKGLHGKLFTDKKAPIPPMHFNCRSLLVPITVYEKFEPTETVKGLPVDTFIKENIGKGFSEK